MGDSEHERDQACIGAFDTWLCSDEGRVYVARCRAEHTASVAARASAQPSVAAASSKSHKRAAVKARRAADARELRGNAWGAAWQRAVADYFDRDASTIDATLTARSLVAHRAARPLRSRPRERRASCTRRTSSVASDDPAPSEPHPRAVLVAGGRP